MQIGRKLNPFERFLTGLEKAGNRLPTPFTIFAVLFFATTLVSLLVSVLGVEMVNPAVADPNGAGHIVRARNFFTGDGIVWFMTSAVTNFTGFAPLGLVLVMTMGIGLCEQVGFINAFIRRVMSNVPGFIVPYAVVFIGLCANLASDSAWVIMPPLAAIVYLGVNRHPIAGMVTGYAGASLGYASNFIISGTDALLSGITGAAVKSSAVFSAVPDFTVDVAANWFFKTASCALLVLLFGAVSSKLIEPRLGPYVPLDLTDESQKPDAKDEVSAALSGNEGKALRFAGICVFLYAALLAAGIVTGFLMNPKTGGIVGSPLLSGIVPVIVVLFFVCGIAYGRKIGCIKSERDISKALAKAMAGMGGYIVMVFMAAQFMAVFSWSNLGTLLSIAGAEGLRSLGFTGIPLIIAFLLLTSLLDFLISSGSAKWAIMAPIFVPMFAMLGFNPAFTQMVYRIGDSVSNVMTPTSAFLFMMLAEAHKKYDKKTTLGTFLSCAFLFFISALMAWILLVILWMLLDLPVGPGYKVYLDAATQALMGIGKPSL